MTIMTNDKNRKSYCNTHNHSNPKSVYELLEKLNNPETIFRRDNLEFPLTTEMLKDIVDYMNSCFQNTQEGQTNCLH